MSFTKINEVLMDKFGSSPMAKKVTAALVCEEFDKIIFSIWGEKIKNTAQAMYLKDKILTVACLSTVVAGEIKMREAELLRNINDKFGKQDIVGRLRLLT